MIMWTIPNTSTGCRRDTELPGVTKISFYTILNERNGEERVKYTFVHASKKKADLWFNAKFKHNLKYTSFIFNRCSAAPVDIRLSVLI